MIERQEIYCHNCDQYVQFDIDVGLNGNHTIVCPNCKHEHYRRVENGIITEGRWGSSNFNTYNCTATSTGHTTYLDSSWLNTTTGTNYMHTYTDTGG